MQELNDTKAISSEFAHLPDSENYINKLENKLCKLKGSDKALSSKSMLMVLEKAKDDYLNRLMTSSSDNLTPFDDDADKEVSVSYLEKKLFPEKIGVTQEELQHLLESDVLAKATAENGCKDSLADVNIDR
ncbi:coiled-coil domain-containing protein 32 [Parasteatoda tepidariorum]|uniref:coiled-coil domain-containing protein 32 n=1 Tax=Parasteatoda tepidariorum TaxID=114398 RepID=UPI001C724FCC|nr:uncharacterized protein LOC107455562 [Parasteatoda tepidariorum]